MPEAKENNKWKLSDVGLWLKNAFLAMLHGQLLQRMKIGKYFIHIIYTFFLFWVSIWLSLQMEKTFTKVEANRKTIENVKIYKAQKTIELASLGRMSRIEKMLKEEGSNLTYAEKPAYKITNRKANRYGR